MDYLIMNLIFLLLMILLGNTTWISITTVATITTLILLGVDKYGKRITNFPGMHDNGVCHVRPHGRNAKDTNLLPVKDKLTNATEYTKQCFWLNNSYIKEIISEFIK